MNTHRKKICFIVSAPITATSFLKDHIASLHKNYEVHVVANIGNNQDLQMLENTLPEVNKFYNIAIERSISIAKDLKAANQLRRLLKQEQFDVIHSVTPKAGLISALAAKAAAIPHRIHIFTGQVWATKAGMTRMLLKSIDKMIATLDNHILVDGESQRRFLIDEGIVSDKKSKVLGAGSICGANTERFTPKEEIRISQRKALGIPDEKIVFTFMGRLNRDKGIFELLQAFNDMVPKTPNAFLLFFGFDEENCMNHLSDYPNISERQNFIFYGPTSTPQLALQAADIFCLPSYREGFGMSVIEASCLGLPVICSDAYGLADTMVDNETGLRCKVKDVESLKNAMMYLYKSEAERLRMGANGRKRVLDLFSGEKIVQAWTNYYDSILK